MEEKMLEWALFDADSRKVCSGSTPWPNGLVKGLTSCWAVDGVTHGVIAGGAHTVLAYVETDQPEVLPSITHKVYVGDVELLAVGKPTITFDEAQNIPKIEFEDIRNGKLLHTWVIPGHYMAVGWEEV
jgi:hypothetical protein